jgi:hypothetical protein
MSAIWRETTVQQCPLLADCVEELVVGGLTACSASRVDVAATAPSL